MAFDLIRSSSEFDRVLSSLRHRLKQGDSILIDDGKFYIERVSNDFGRMISRRSEDFSIAGQLGSYSRTCGDKWSCNFPAGREKPLFGPSETQEDAIALLWFSRILI